MPAPPRPAGSLHALAAPILALAFVLLIGCGEPEAPPPPPPLEIPVVELTPRDQEICATLGPR